MQTTERYLYGKADKLKSSKAIELLFKNGKNFSDFPFKVFWLPENSLTILQAGVGVSSRTFKKATDRNRVKRLMREAYRLQKNALFTHLEKEGCRCSVFILYIGKELPAYELVYKKTGAILNKLISLNNGKNKTDI